MSKLAFFPSLVLSLLVVPSDTSAAIHTVYANDFDGEKTVVSGGVDVLVGGSIEDGQGFKSVSGFGGNLLHNRNTGLGLTTLTITNLPEHNRLDLYFSLALIDSWDSDNTQWGPDYFSVLVDSETVFSEMMPNPFMDNHASDGTLLARYQQLFQRNDNNSNASDNALDMGNETGFFSDISHSADTVTIAWLASGENYNISESFGLDNIRVDVRQNPEPSTFLVWSLLFAGVGATRYLRRRRASDE